MEAKSKKKKNGIRGILVFIVIVLLLGYYSYGIVKGTAKKDGEAGVKPGPRSGRRCQHHL
ncbi:MAG: hypothetical protein V8R80_09875 [Eubacterium sp.]